VSLRAKLAALAATLAVMAAPQTASAYLPPGFFGIVPQEPPSETDYQLMEEAGVRSVRLPLFWSEVQPARPSVKRPDWSVVDFEVERAAEHGMSILLNAFATPRWISRERFQEPVTPWKLRAWALFLHQAARRYGPDGRFWWENEEVPYDPVRDWEIWNEENIVTFGDTDPEDFARLIRTSGRALHRNDPGSKVIIGGFFGRPLQIPPNVSAAGFLQGIYEAGNVKRYFDGVALHPYVAAAKAMRWEILGLRQVMHENHDGGTPVYVTELGWGSARFESRWERGPHGQARELNNAFAMLAGHRLSWRIGGVWWYSWLDRFDVCQFCDSAGLLTRNREAKPAFYRFTEWTGGDPNIVPRASFLE
jgi:hypothetical protein